MPRPIRVRPHYSHSSGELRQVIYGQSRRCNGGSGGGGDDLSLDGPRPDGQIYGPETGEAWVR